MDLYHSIRFCGLKITLPININSERMSEKKKMDSIFNTLTHSKLLTVYCVLSLPNLLHLTLVILNNDNLLLVELAICSLYFTLFVSNCSFYPKYWDTINTIICMRNLDSLLTACQKTEPLPYKLS